MGDGPYVQEQFRIPTRRADANTTTDYIQFLVRQVASGRYGFRADLDGVSKGTIYRTLPEMEAEMESQLENLIVEKDPVNGQN